MTVPVWVVVGAFAVFLALYWVHHLGAERPGPGSRRARWLRPRAATRGEMTIVWIFTLIALPIFLLQARTSWAVRGVVLGGFLAILALATAWITSRDD